MGGGASTAQSQFVTDLPLRRRGALKGLPAYANQMELYGPLCPVE